MAVWRQNFSGNGVLDLEKSYHYKLITLIENGKYILAFRHPRKKTGSNKHKKKQNLADNANEPPRQYDGEGQFRKIPGLRIRAENE